MVTLIAGVTVSANAQSFVFAQMGGTPLNTSGWNLQGNAYIGNTGSNTGNGELILTNPVNFQSGSAFYNVPINLAQCSKWIAEFQFRIAEGSAADGLAFCYLDVPPTGFVSGGGLGIPATANGLKVGIDTWVNCGSDAVPKIQLRWGNTYDECNGQPTKNNNDGSLSFIRNGQYHDCKIEYDKGNISVSINGVQRITGFQTFNFLGYFGFTASTGGSTDRHSIRNVKIYTEMPPSEAGTNAAICNNASTQIGAANNPAYQYSWTPAVGLSSTNNANPTVTLTNTGTTTFVQKYYLRTEFANLPGCGSTDSVLVTVYPQPKADFTATNNGCIGNPVFFMNNATAHDRSITQWLWNFGDNTTASGSLPSKAYLVPGDYTIQQKIVSNDGCVDSSTQTVRVSAVPIPIFRVAGASCVNDSIQLEDDSFIPTGKIERWIWDYGNRRDTATSSINPKVLFNTSGPKAVTLFVETNTGCMSSFPLPIEVGEYPVVDFSLPEVCLQDAFAFFKNNSSIPGGNLASTQWRWNFGDMNALPGANVSNTFDGQHKYSDVGNYTVQLFAETAGGCKDSLAQQLIVNGDNPVADFTVMDNGMPVCSNLPLKIQNKSTVNFGSITKTVIYWNWPSGTDTTIDELPQFDKIYTHQYPVFTSPDMQMVTIRLVTYSGDVCVSEYSQDVALYAKPLLVFEAVPGICIDGLPRLITQATELSGAVGVGFYSGIGIDSMGTLSPSLLSVGQNLLTYTFITNSGCVDSVKQNVTVWPRPTASFSYLGPACQNQAFTVADASTANANQLSKWDWNFGGGNLLSRNDGLPFSYTFSNTGTSLVELVVTTDSGCVSLPAQLPVVVQHVPVPSFILPVVCMPAGIATFTNQSSIGDGTAGQLSYRWHFGVAGSTSALANPTFTYSSVGVYPVKLVVTSKDGCSDSLTQILSEVYPQPMANFSVSPNNGVCLGDAFQFSDASNPLTQSINSWQWDFGDGQTSTTQNPNHTFRSAGSFVVKMWYTTNKGCVSDTSISVPVVHPFPVVNAGPDLFVLEGGQAIIPATVSGSSNYVYSWSPATDLSNANTLQPVVRPAFDRTYTLTVAGAGGCSSTDDLFVKVLLAPVIPNAFSPNGDGINDVWTIRYLDSYVGAIIRVFDRYGKNVFTSTGYQVPWNGKYKDKDVPVGVYYYIIDPKNGRKPISGSVTIVR